ncbi:MAG: hypothetical protein JST48_03015 [Bacteroidetes bacterium]|nr:hypothetical protein [Bacteroidota bacterium]
MTPERKKTIAIVIGTFLIGVLIGVLGTGLLARQHYNKEKIPHDKEIRVSSRQKLLKKILNKIHADSIQEKTIRPIIEKTLDDIDSIQTRSRREGIAAIDSMETQLKPMLNQDQIDRLKKIYKSYRDGLIIQKKKKKK